MNKKFLSAILFGALMVTSTGTFVSCKDYDDDIKGLQTQIDSNKNAIAELQKLVGAGNWVTNVTASGENLVVTMSNGTTATIAGIKGADGKDGKNAAEWTISEDGFWCVDGVKTANVAVAKDGKDGLTAPSPSISEDGMWVVYAWDEAKGEFVAEETEIPAAGTSAYVVLKNGVYTLNIADETGEFVEVSLPATAESFVINEIANMDVVVKFAYGEWKTPSTKKDKEMFDKLAAEFPALKEYKDKQLVEQGGKLPFIVSPANVEFTKEHTFALVDLKGKDIEAVLSNPTMGLPENLSVETNYKDSWIESRASEGSAVWSLDFAPAKNPKGTLYVDDKNGVYSLVASGAKGVISATAYAYRYDVHKADGLDLGEDGGYISKTYNEEGIDIFAYTNEDPAHITLPAEVLNGKFILEAVDPAQVEEYGISIEGSVVTIADMPKGNSISASATTGIQLKLTAIAVDGSVDELNFNLGVQNEIAATGALADMEVVLTGKLNKKGEYDGTTQTIYWSLDALELSALQMREFVNASTKTLTIKNVDVDDATASGNIMVADLYDADKKKTEDYTKVAYIAANIEVNTVVPGNYEVVLTASNTSGVILKAVSDLELINPEIEALAAIKEGFMDEDGVAIVTSLTAYDLNSLFNFVGGTSLINLVDTDNQYDANEFKSWWDEVKENPFINPGAWTTWENETAGTEDYSEVDNVRTIKATVKMFGNQANTEEIEFKVKWVSAIYAEDAADVITMTPAKLKIKFDATTAAPEANIVNFTSITSAVFAEGGEKGKTYPLFRLANGTVSGTGSAAKYDYSDWKKAGAYVMGSTDVVELSFANFQILKNLLAFVNKYDVTTEAEGSYVAGTAKYKLTNAHMKAIWDVVNLYKNNDLTDKYQTNANGKVVTVTYYDTEKLSDGSYVYVHEKKNEDGTYDQNSKKVLVSGAKVYEHLYDASLMTLPTTTAEQEAALKAMTVIPAVHKAYVDFYVNTLATLTSFTKTANKVDADTNYDPRYDGIKSVSFKFVNEGDANFATLTDVDTASGQVSDGDFTKGATLTAKASTSIDKTALTSGKKVIPMEMIITDMWGKVMTYEFEVEISL